MLQEILMKVVASKSQMLQIHIMGTRFLVSCVLKCCLCTVDIGIQESGNSGCAKSNPIQFFLIF